MNIDALIAQRLKAHRSARGWSLDELAQRSGVSRAMISRIERCDSSPTAGLLAKLSDALGVSLSSLMTEADAPRHAVSRRSAQPLWRDPETGYVRCMVSPPADETDAEIVAIELPAGARVAYEPLRNVRYDQQVLVLDGRLRVQLGREAVDLDAGDCLRMALDQDHAFENTGAVAVRYLVIVRKAASLPAAHVQGASR
jgi:transcriptional regulator with XRE-family HTH domain